MTSGDFCKPQPTTAALNQWPKKSGILLSYRIQPNINTLKEKHLWEKQPRFCQTLGIKAKQAAGDLRQRYRKHKVSDPWLSLFATDGASSEKISHRTELYHLLH